VPKERNDEKAAWRGAAFERARRPALFLGACMATSFVKRAAPANGPARSLSLGGEIDYSNRPLGKTSRWVIRGSRLFNVLVWPFSLCEGIYEVLGHVLKRLPSRRVNPTAHFTPPTTKPSASSVARTLATWSPWISMVRSLTVPPVLQAARSFLATFSIMEAGKWVAKS
jgi:hypothetical protein